MNDKMQGSAGGESLRGLNPAALLSILVAESDPAKSDVPGWELLNVAGQGGLGIVWRAKRTRDGVLGAIKFASPSDIDTIERIEEEATALRSLDHPHIVRLLESGNTENGGLFLAMEYVDGISLSHQIPVQGLAAARAFALFHQMASAVEHAHSRGVIHRDLKPGNILICEDGNLKVADFGLARPIHERTQRLTVTQTGLIAGTVEYLPPEAYLPDYRPGISGDIYALGIILYDMLTGAPPRGAWRAASEIRPVDIRIDEVLRKALTPVIAERWKSVADMDAALREIEASPVRYSGSPVVTRPIRLLDAAWTLLGIFIFVAALGVMMKTSLSRIASPIDLVGPHAPCTGGFQALTYLLFAMVPLCVWQIARIFIFRAVPLRESLPSPFGMKLGSYRCTACVVAIAQLLCLIVPVIFLADVWFNVCNEWLKPGDPAWKHGLVVTTWGSDNLVSPWSWPKSGENYWLIQRSGLPGDPLGRQIDRVAFIPGFIPRLMVGSVVLIGLTLLTTLGVAILRWWPYHRERVQSVFLVALVITTWHLWPTDPPTPLSEEKKHLRTLERWRDERLTYLRFSDDVFRALYPGPPPAWEVFPPELLAHYAAEVHFRRPGRSLRAQVAGYLAREAAAARTDNRTTKLLGTDSRDIGGADGLRFQNAATILEFTDPPERNATAVWVRRTHMGTIIPGTGISIERESYHHEKVYSLEPRTLEPAEARTYALELFAAFAADPVAGQPDRLDDFFTTKVIQVNNGWRSNLTEHRVFDRPAYTAALRVGVVRGGAPVLAGEPGPIQAQTGARQRITIPIREGTATSTWTADLVFQDGKWRAVSIRF